MFRADGASKAGLRAGGINPRHAREKIPEDKEGLGAHRPGGQRGVHRPLPDAPWRLGAPATGDGTPSLALAPTERHDPTLRTRLAREQEPPSEIRRLQKDRRHITVEGRVPGEMGRPARRGPGALPDRTPWSPPAQPALGAGPQVHLQIVGGGGAEI